VISDGATLTTGCHTESGVGRRPTAVDGWHTAGVQHPLREADLLTDHALLADRVGVAAAEDGRIRTGRGAVTTCSDGRGEL